MLRSHTCGELNKKQIDEKIELAGWVHSRRDHGGIIFIDLRDRYGITQIKFNPAISAELSKKAEDLRKEWVIQIGGKVIARPSEMVNEKLELILI
jgi:aspartyl-tRNA synthetase